MSTTPNTSTSSGATVALLQNPGSLPVREFDKLSPVPSVASCGSTNDKSDPSANRKSGRTGHSERLRSSSSSSQTDNRSKSVDETIETTKSNCKRADKERPADTINHKPSTDETIILRICDLEYAANRSSSILTAIKSNAENRIVVKTKIRTKTDPHPVASPKKQQRSTTCATSTLDLKAYQKLSPRNQHSGSKCNCSSCGAGKSSTLDKQNKKKSVGTQHNATNAYDPWIKQGANADRPALRSNGDSSGALKNALAGQKVGSSTTKVIVITDDFKRKALNQEVLVDSKRNILRYMKSNKMLNSSRSMDDVRIAAKSASSKENGSGANPMNDNINEHGMNSSVLSMANADADDADGADGAKQKAISKSFDNISLLSNELDALDNVGSVELIFISDEFLNKVSDQDVIVLKNCDKIGSSKFSMGKTLNGTNALQFSGKAATSNVRKQIVVVTDEFCRKSMNNKNIVIVDEPKRNGRTKGPKLNRQSSGESSVDDVNNKITSRAFRSYDEETEHLESKEIKQ